MERLIGGGLLAIAYEARAGSAVCHILQNSYRLAKSPIE